MTPYTTTKNGNLTPNRAWVMKTAWAHVARVNQGPKVIRRALKWAWEDARNKITVHRAGLADGACVRVTPALFSTPADCARLVAALQDLVPKIARG